MLAISIHFLQFFSLTYRYATCSLSQTATEQKKSDLPQTIHLHQLLHSIYCDPSFKKILEIFNIKTCLLFVKRKGAYHTNFKVKICKIICMFYCISDIQMSEQQQQKLLNHYFFLESKINFKSMFLKRCVKIVHDQAISTASLMNIHISF